eukprot:CAMPEP_0114673224 /NCGR_PEP_ID=MMETSP0191-20121206/44323_1 /TAXON_ID=126664 /ORGANISM="Sorites sp." /LENGTH=75 /DNA_ID=CAMNT_0001937611 /DNA_START=840 /DNA_END=1064 /DNA_ORIENTATION=+
MTQYELYLKKTDNSFYEGGITGLAWSYDGNELAASYSSKSIALFQLNGTNKCDINTPYNNNSSSNNNNNSDDYEV